MFWENWNWVEFLCYTGIIILISSTVTARYMIKNREMIKDKEKKLDRSKIFTAYKLKDKQWWNIRFHKSGTIPDDAEKRIYPPLHAGGAVEKEIDTFIMARMREGATRKQAWDEAILKYYPEHVIEDNIYMRGEYNNMKKRVKGRYSKTHT